MSRISSTLLVFFSLAATLKAQMPVNVLNTSSNETAAAISLDGNQIVFASDRKGGKGEMDIYIARLDNGSWRVSNAGGLNSPKSEGSGCLSADGMQIVFSSNRKGGKGDYDLYVADNVRGDWKNIRNLGVTVNTSAAELFPSLSADGRALYFSSNRNGGAGGFDIYKSESNEKGEWGVPALLQNEINSAGDDDAPFICADNSTLYFSSNGRAGAGGRDLFMSRSSGTQWSKSVSLGANINSPSEDLFVTSSPYVNELIVSSRRSGDGNIYSVAVPEELLPNPVTIVSGSVIDGGTKKIPGAVMIGRDASGMRLRSQSGSSGTFLFALNGSLHSLELTTTDGKKMYQSSLELPPTDKAVLAVKRDIPTTGISAGYAMSYSRLPLGTVQPPAVVTVTETSTDETTPILPYIFFEEASADIPSRYTRLHSNDEAKTFNEANIPGDALACYHTLLNVIGKRLATTEKEATLYIVGCTDGVEKGGEKLAERRAEAVKRYLKTVWFLEDDRFEVESRMLPANASEGDSPDARAENRRVSLESRSYDLFRPIVRAGTARLTAPDHLWLFTSVDHAKFRVRQGSRPMATPDAIGTKPFWWNLRDEKGTAPEEGTSLSVSVFSGTVESSPVEIPVKFSRAGAGRGKSIRLIGFDQSSEEISGADGLVLESVKKLTSGGKFSVTAWAPEKNDPVSARDLATKRAEAVRKELLRGAEGRTVTVDARGIDALPFVRSTPEGRFYNRGVEIIIQ